MTHRFHFDPPVDQERVLVEQLRDFEFEKWLDELHSDRDQEDYYATMREYDLLDEDR